MIKQIILAVIAAIISAIGASMVMTARNDEKIAAMNEKIGDIEVVVRGQLLNNSEAICQNRERIAKLEGCK